VTLVQDLKAIRFVEGTKISHDYEGNQVNTFSYRELCNLKSPAIGIPCRQNNIVIVDVDVAGPTHKKDGREFWLRFTEDNGIPQTYTVRTPTGGYHFYFKLPVSVNPDTFSPPAELAAGVDIKWNGWAGAPPSAGYSIEFGNIQTIEVAPPSLLMYMAQLNAGKGVKTYDITTGAPSLTLHRPFSEAQLRELKNKIEWVQTNGTLSRPEWRDGLFALKAGVEDPELLDELAVKWTMNKGYSVGDENLAREMVARADKHGAIGPGSILSIIKQIQMREGAPIIETPFTTQEIIDKSKVQIGWNKDGSIKVEASESNAAALLGAIFDDKTLYHDIRTDLYIYKGRPHSDSELVNLFMPLIQSPAYGLGMEKFRRSSVAAGLDILMAARQTDPHKEYLKCLVWDGVSRIEKFFPEYVGTENSEYTRLVSKNFWVSLSARGLQPGCKFDSMVVIEGHEGIYKSSLVQAIGGDYTYAPSKKDALKDLDTLRAMHQSVIVELPELLGIVGESSEQVKGFLSKPFDHIRSLYAKKAMRSLRGFVFVGTTNTARYLKDSMGVRRFWPIQIPSHVKSIKLGLIKADRDQLFAEGIAMFNDGYKYWEMPTEMLDSVVDSKVISDPLMAPIKEIIPALGKTWTSTEIYRRLEAAGYLPRGLTGAVVTRIEGSLLRLGYERHDSSLGILWQAKDVFLGLDNLI